MDTRKGNILIVDDNKELLAALSMLLKPHFRQIDTERNPNVLPALLRKKTYDIILLDMNFTAGVNSGNEGIYWMRELLKIDPQATIVLITAYGDVDLAVRSMKEGAADFIQKSWDEDKMLSTILSAYKLRESKLEIKKLRDRQAHLSQANGRRDASFRCQSRAMQEVYTMVEKVAATDVDVLITGENGTGKEVLAREIHRNSPRSDDVFMHVDLGAIPEALFESELFGHTKGAFTDAKADRAGKFESASGGTLFLDEIGNLPLPLQSKLLSTLQSRRVARIGSNKSIAVDIRLVSATNQPLFDMAERGLFREDLLYRINTIQIDVPPLRERPEDIPGLAGFFLKKNSDKYHKPQLRVSDKSLEKMQQYSWPGNIRELEHAIEKAVILSNQKELATELLVPDQPGASPAQSTTFNLEENEKQIIARALKQFRGNISLTANKLGINRSTLYTKIRKYGLS